MEREAAENYCEKTYGKEFVGMYRCEDSEEGTMNLCPVCVVENEECFDEIIPTLYDADCDECGWCFHDVEDPFEDEVLE